LANHYSDLLALESIKLCASYLKRAVDNGQDLEARAGMGWASTLAGIAISFVDVIIGHHVSEAVGAILNTHHGETAAALLPYAMEFNFNECKEKISNIALAIGENISRLNLEEGAKKGIEAVRKLLSYIGIPEHLTSLGVNTSMIPKLIEILKNRFPYLEEGNPRKITENNIIEFIKMTL